MMMKKFYFILTFLIMVALFFVMPVSAEEHTHNEADGWVALNSLTLVENDYRLVNAKYYLTEDIELEKTLLVNGASELDLNGYTLSLKKDTDHVITINNKHSLILTDSKNTGIITGLNNANANHIADYGGGINIDSGKFVMNGGTITQCTAHHGGGVYVSPNGQFEMNGGCIDSCYAVQGAGIYNEGTTVINGGTISDCGNSLKKIEERIEQQYNAQFGGGIYNSGKMTINDGIFSGCHASLGGGIYNKDGNNSALLVINGGTFKNNESDFHNNGDDLYTYRPVTINGGCLEDSLYINKTTLELGGSSLLLGNIRMVDGNLSVSASWEGYNRTGYTFDGWFKQFNTSYAVLNLKKQKSGNMTYSGSGDETIQARWTKAAETTKVDTPKPTETATKQATATPKPVETEIPEATTPSPTQTPASPLPFAGILAGCAAALLVSRRL